MMNDDDRMPMTRTRVTIWKGRVFMAPPGFTVLGPNRWGRLLATNGTVILEMTDVGQEVLDEND